MSLEKSKEWEKDEEYEYEEYDAPLFHPTKILIYLLLAGLTMIFVGLTAAYLYTRLEQGIAPIHIPIIFIVNTLILLGTGLLIRDANKAYLDDDTKRYQRNLLITICLTLLFMGLQAVGFYQLMETNRQLFMANDTARSYLQVLTFLHFLHVLGGLPFLILFYRISKKKMIDPVSVLIYFSDPEKKLRLQLLTIYWHFLDVLWIYLILFFWINSLIK